MVKEELIFFSDMPGSRVHVINVEKGEVNMFACLNSIRSFASSVQAKINTKFSSSLFTSVEHRVMKEIGNELKLQIGVWNAKFTLN